MKKFGTFAGIQQLKDAKIYILKHYKVSLKQVKG
jgi:hypothetical protein